MASGQKKLKLRITFLIILSILCIIILAVQLWRLSRPHYSDMQLNNFKSSDAKLGYHGYVITSKSEHLYLINSNTKQVNRVFIRSNWVDCLVDENIIVYSNTDQKSGVCRFNPDDASIYDHYEIFKDNTYRIDPSIDIIGDTYYLSTTLIEGTVNNNDPNKENGKYTIQIFKSKDLENWEYITDVYSAQKNVEDIDLFVEKDNLRIIFEQEEYDKGPSQIIMMDSYDNGETWSDPITLVDNGADNEPASFLESDDEYWLFYSSDINYPGESYRGGEAFLGRYNKNFELQQIRQLNTNNKSQLLLYQAEIQNGEATILYSNDYLGNDDLCLENIGFVQLLID